MTLIILQKNISQDANIISKGTTKCRYKTQDIADVLFAEYKVTPASRNQNYNSLAISVRKTMVSSATLRRQRTPDRVEIDVRIRLKFRVAILKKPDLGKPL